MSSTSIDSYSDVTGIFGEACTESRKRKLDWSEDDKSDLFAPCKYARQEEIPVDDISYFVGMLTSLIPCLSRGNGRCAFKTLVSELVHIAGHMGDCGDVSDYDSSVSSRADDSDCGTEYEESSESRTLDAPAPARARSEEL